MHRTDHDGGDGRREPPARPFQFTLRTMFLVTTVVAVVLAGLSAPEDWEWLRYVTVFYVAVAVPIVPVVALIYGRGYVRTFAIGALFPAGAILWVLLWLALFVVLWTRGWSDLNLPADAEQRRLILILGTAVAAVLVLLGGIIAVVVRRLVEPRRTDWDLSKAAREPTTNDETLEPEGDVVEPAGST